MAMALGAGEMAVGTATAFAASTGLATSGTAAAIATVAGVFTTGGRGGNCKTVAGSAAGFFALGAAAAGGAALINFGRFAACVLLGVFALVPVGFRAGAFALPDTFFFTAAGAAVARADATPLRAAPLPAAAFEGAGFRLDVFRAAFAGAFAMRLVAVAAEERRAAVVAFGLAACLRDGFAATLAGRAGFATRFAGFLATAADAAFAVRPVVRPFFDLAVAFITLPAVRAPGTPRPWAFVARIGPASDEARANPGTTVARTPTLSESRARFQSQAKYNVKISQLPPRAHL